jgi:hypothetical protein
MSVHSMKDTSRAKQIAELESHLKNSAEHPSVVMIITPELAEYILTKLQDGGNRSRRPAKIKRFAVDMSEGNWRLSGDTIKFGKSGMLKDGQHRLRACILSGKPFKTHVVFGIEERCFTVIDTGSAKTNADAFQLATIDYPRQSSMATRWLMIYELDAANPNRGMTISNTDLLNFYREHVDEELMKAACADAIAIGKPFPVGALAGLLYRFIRHDRKATLRMVADLKAPKGGGKKLVEMFNDLRKQNGGRMHELQAHAMIIKAFICYRDGKTANKNVVRWTEASEFPVV